MRPHRSPGDTGGHSAEGDEGSGRKGNEGGGEASGGTEAQAKNVCLRYLATRARSRAELDEQLTRRGFAASVRTRILDRLAAAHLVDDAEFAREWVRSRHLHSGKSRTAIAMELRDKGIAPELAGAALADISRDDERDKAADLVRRKLRSLDADEATGDRAAQDRLARRLVGMLARRGYPQGLVFDVVKEVLAQARIEAESTDLIDLDPAD